MIPDGLAVMDNCKHRLSSAVKLGLGLWVAVDHKANQLKVWELSCFSF